MNSMLFRIMPLIRRWLTGGYRYPALDITLGARRLHLVGTVHMGTPDMAPLPAALLHHLARADALLVEADLTRAKSPFSDVPSSQGNLSGLTEVQQTMLQRRCNEAGIATEVYQHRVAWQIALMLQAQQAWQLGLRPHYGIEQQLLDALPRYGTPLIELEGGEAQLALLKELPDDGLPLLQDTLEQWQPNARLLQMMVSWWLGSPPVAGEKSLTSTFSHDLNNVLMQERNQRWCQIISQLPAGRYVVAVGALHLYCEQSLPQLLRHNMQGRDAFHSAVIHCDIVQ
ncbi:MAG: hypothetical protein XXXJIFNMEKO3_00584 [Candidatus Erwinia impunctatus]|nr:hypothetical protein XXXJIFNMEKO_00584 [Culicoides impunctatus]